MKSKGYLIFHLNLAFSSIDEHMRSDVIQACYHPLLDLIDRTGIPIGIELSGWTLNQINNIDSIWVDRFKKLLELNKCELVGSGYCQIIGPLVPHEVNVWNQKLGLDVYKQVLGRRPDIVLVNEMAFSQSLVDLYSQFDYKALVMDRDNIKLVLASDEMPSHAAGINDTKIPILWSDSIMFQKMQHFAHGDISLKDYIDYLKKRVHNGDSVLPIYCNDAEVFDYRPGRFNEERSMHQEGEWNRIERFLKVMKSEIDIELVSPSNALIYNLEKNIKFISKITNAAYPIPVKKQAKYNISRWAVTGRHDLWINTLCHRIHKHLIKSKNNSRKDWEELCELWSSDLRTHLTEKRWTDTKKQLNLIMKKHNIKNNFSSVKKTNRNHDCLDNVIGLYGGASISLKNDDIILSIATKELELDLNLRRGLAIHKLAFASHKMVPCIGTLQHGHFESILLGADYYSGNTIIELPLLRKRLTDLESVRPTFAIKDDNNIEVHAVINTMFGTILKIVNINSERERVSLSYHFIKFQDVFACARLANITLLNSFSNENTQLLLANGGEENEIFDFLDEFDHSNPASTLVSSSRGVGATTGKIKILNNNKNLCLQWDPSECAVMPLLTHTTNNTQTLSRIFFSISELDDTVKKASSLSKSFTLDISV